MDFQFFGDLTDVEAQAYLDRFLTEALTGLAEMVQDMAADGLVFRWALDHVTFKRRELDPSLPAWIRESPTAKANAFDLDDQSRVIVMRAARYLGECFVRLRPETLRWTTGEVGLAAQRQP